MHRVLKIFLVTVACAIIAEIGFMAWQMDTPYSYLYKSEILKTSTVSSESCQFKSFVKENNVTVHYYSKSLENLKSVYGSCSSLNSSGTIIIKHQIDETFKLLLDPDYIFKKNGLSRTNSKAKLKCSVSLFDKKMKSADLLGNLHLAHKHFASNEMQVNESRKFEFTGLANGFYLIECWFVKNSFSLSKLVYNEVVTILPKNMTKLIDANQATRQHTEKLRRSLKRSKRNNEMLALAEYEECDSLPGGELPDKMNVLILGIDSVSYPYLKRAFPLTHAYLAKELEGSLLFENLNIVGMNTYPNMLPMLSGVVKEENDELGIADETLYFTQVLEQSSYHDVYPFVWYDYERLGYLTMYHEDTPSATIFCTRQKGFR
jgi:hypothetical protein